MQIETLEELKQDKQKEYDSLGMINEKIFYEYYCGRHHWLDESKESEWRNNSKKMHAIQKERADISLEISKLNKSCDNTNRLAEIEERRAIKEATVTSLTYERCRRRLNREVAGFISGK